MGSGTGDSTPTRITLIYDDAADSWVARDGDTGVSAQGPSRQAALEALDTALLSGTEEDDGECETDPTDPFFTAQTFSSGRSDISANIDAYLAARSHPNRTGSNADS